MAYDYLEGTVVNPSAPEESLERKVPYVDNGIARLDPKRYYDPAFMAEEWQKLWPKTWLIAGVIGDLPEVGSYMLFYIGRESIIVSRTGDGLKAFHNTCAHRGTRLLSEPRGKKRQFVCPFHFWRYSNDGKVLSVTDEDTFREEVLCPRPGLSPVLVEEHAGIVFINMDLDAPPLKDRIGLPPGYLEAYNIDKMKVVRHISTEWAANWKIGVEAFYESYHLHAVHPETRDVMADLDVQYDLYPHGASRMVVPLGRKSPRIADRTSMTAGLDYMLTEAGVDPDEYQGDATGVRDAIQRSKRARAKNLSLDYDGFSDRQLSDSWATGIFPNVQIGCHPEGVFLMRFLPHSTDPEKFIYDTMTLLRPVDDPNYATPGWMGIPEGTDLSGNTRPDCEHFGVGEKGDLGLVLDQDADLLPVVQAGVRSRGFKGQLWGEQEQRLRHFNAEVDRYLKG